MGTMEVICCAVGAGITVLGAGIWRVRAARQQRWMENQSWRELFVRLEREQGGSRGWG